MTVYVPIRRGLGGHPVAVVPAPPSDNYHTILAGISGGPRKHLALDDSNQATVADNTGSVAGDGTYLNTAEIAYRVGSLISGEPSGGAGMRSVAFSGSFVTPPRITLDDLVTAASYTIDLAVQLDRLPLTGSKFVLVTQGLSSSILGATSMEVLAGGQIRWWTTTASGFREIISVATLVAGVATKLTFRQENGAGRFIYIGGAPASGGSDVSVTSLPAPPVGTWHIGAWPNGNDPFKGVINEVAAWDAAIAASSIATLGARAQTILELGSVPAQTFATSDSGVLDLLALGITHPDSGWEIEIISAGTNASLTSFALIGPGNTTISWTTSATAGSASPQVRLTKDAGAIVSATRTISITIQASGSVARCYEGAGGTVVDLGTATNKETVTNLSIGGNARYNATGIISRTRWTGSQGCSSPNRSATTEQFLFRFTADHNGGCISGGAMYGNVTWHDNYDSGNSHPTWGGTKNWQLYPCGDGGQVFVDRPNQGVKNFTIEGFRDHACWDPYRISTRTRADNITFNGCWSTCVRDDWLQNDGGANCTAEDCLIGDVIGTGVTNSGCWVWYSCTTSGAAENFVTLKNCLVWSSRMYAPGRPRANLAGGYASGAVLKIDKGGAPKMSITNCVIMADIQGISSNNGDPLFGFKPGSSNPSPVTECSDNILIWRDLANRGSYQSLFGDPPPGFTILTGSEGESFWNERVFEWKAAHPNVRRFNISGIAHAFGGKDIDLVDAG